MAGRPRQPIELIEAKGRKHLTKAEIAERKATEVKPVKGRITPPAFLSKPQKTKFRKISAQLAELGIFGATDCEALARYITAQDLYLKATEALSDEVIWHDPDTLAKLAGVQDRFFRQANTAAHALGLTIDSRCKLVVPKPAIEVRVNKFSEFEKEAEGE